MSCAIFDVFSSFVFAMILSCIAYRNVIYIYLFEGMAVTYQIFLFEVSIDVIKRITLNTLSLTVCLSDFGIEQIKSFVD